MRLHDRAVAAPQRPRGRRWSSSTSSPERRLQVQRDVHALAGVVEAEVLVGRDAGRHAFAAPARERLLPEAHLAPGAAVARLVAHCGEKTLTGVHRSGRGGEAPGRPAAASSSTFFYLMSFIALRKRSWAAWYRPTYLSTFMVFICCTYWSHSALTPAGAGDPARLVALPELVDVGLEADQLLGLGGRELGPHPLLPGLVLVVVPVVVVVEELRLLVHREPVP